MILNAVVERTPGVQTARGSTLRGANTKPRGAATTRVQFPNTTPWLMVFHHHSPLTACSCWSGWWLVTITTCQQAGQPCHYADQVTMVLQQPPGQLVGPRCASYRTRVRSLWSPWSPGPLGPLSQVFLNSSDRNLRWAEGLAWMNVSIWACAKPQGNQ